MHDCEICKTRHSESPEICKHHWVKAPPSISKKQHFCDKCFMIKERNSELVGHNPST
jgi:hypothetical protein